MRRGWRQDRAAMVRTAKTLLFCAVLAIARGSPLGVAWAEVTRAGSESAGGEWASKEQEAVDIPANLKECFVQLKKHLPPDELERFRAGEEQIATTSAHHGLGMWIRNNWGLWGGSRLAVYFNGLGIRHPDDMFSIILDSFHRHLNGKDLRLEEQVQHYQAYWKQVGAGAGHIELDGERSNIVTVE